MRKFITTLSILGLVACTNPSIEDGLANLSKTLTELEAQMAAIDIDATLDDLQSMEKTVAEMEQESAEVDSMMEQLQSELANIKASVEEIDLTGSQEQLEILRDKLVKVKEGLNALTLLLDDDLDGIVNAYDICPDTEKGVEVDLNGCSDDQLAD